MFNSSYEQITYLQQKTKALSERVAAFESGDIYVRMKEEHKKTNESYAREIAKLRRENSDLHREVVHVREIWSQSVEDLEAEFNAERRAFYRIISSDLKRMEEQDKRIRILKQQLRDEKVEKYEALTLLEEERGKNLKLTAQMNHNYENSSLPSSASIGHKKITNNREKTGRKPGAQPDHEAHPRKKHTPSNTVFIPAPEEYLDTSRYSPAGEIVKQVIGLRTLIEVTEFCTPVFIDRHTGHKVHAPFPEGVTDDVNYDGSVKAFAFLMTNRCNVSIDKTTGFISDITNGELTLSKGMVCNLLEQFSKKTEEERKKIIADMVCAPVMHTDFTSARVNGKNANVLVCATDNETIYQAKEHKGHKGIIGSPVEHYNGILIHDHDTTFYSYGGGHQECEVHHLRYLKDSMENEPDLTWNRRMRELIQEMIHYTNGIEEGCQADPATIEQFKRRYDEILDTAREEYEDVPPSDYYRDGYNLYKRMEEYKEYNLTFLTDRRVVPDNNVAERLARIYKRKQKQVMTMRSFDNLNYLCDALSMIDSLCKKKNIFLATSKIFGTLVPVS